MSDLMLYGVLHMPYEMAMHDHMSRIQYYQRAREAAVRLEKAERRLAEIEAASTIPASEGDLLPLPKPECLVVGVYGYRESHMRAYGKECARAALASTPTASDTRTAAGEAECDAALRAAPAGQLDAALAALKPFADAYAPEAARMARFYTAEDVARYGEQWDANTITVPATMGDFRRAYEAYLAIEAELASRGAAQGRITCKESGEVDVEAERKHAEYEYSISAFDYARDPIGSRDWTLFWSGYQAAARTQADAGKAGAAAHSAEGE